MDKFKMFLGSLVIFAVTFYVFDRLFIHDSLSKAISTALFGALGFCSYTYLVKPYIKRRRSKS